jgi:hypothetical protein
MDRGRSTQMGVFRMYHLHATVSETVSGWVCRASLSDIDDSRSTRLVATHGPLLVAREGEGESDLGAALRTLDSYSGYLTSRQDLISRVVGEEKL